MSEKSPIIEGVDFARLRSWIEESGLASGQIENIETLAGGTQNILLRFDMGSQAFVLRRPPINKRDDNDKTLHREATIMSALSGSSVPHPSILAFCRDETVLGSSFVLIEEIDGFNASAGLPPLHASNPQLRLEMGLSMTDAIAALGNLDYIALGLADFGQPDGFLERQVPRWRRQLAGYSKLDGYDGPAIPGIEQVGDWLEEKRPSSFRPGIMHGDFHMGNLLFDTNSGRIKAVLDWELSTIGDPLLDLGALLACWSDDEHGLKPTLPVEPWAGFPSRDQLMARYGDQSLSSLENIAWYEVLACFRLGIILEGTHARACAGLVPQKIGERLRLGALEMFKRAHIRMK